MKLRDEENMGERFSEQANRATDGRGGGGMSLLDKEE